MTRFKISNLKSSLYKTIKTKKTKVVDSDVYSSLNYEDKLLVKSHFVIFKMILFLSIIAVGVLFLPFAKSALIAIIFSFAIVGAKDKISHSSRRKKLVLLGATGIASITFLLVFISMIKILFSSVSSVSDPESFLRFKVKVSELFLPTIHVFKEFASKTVSQFDKTGLIESKISELANSIFDSLVTLLFKWISEVPNYFLQYVFFVFILIFLLSKMKLIKHYVEGLFLRKNHHLLEFLISTAKASGYNAIFAMIVTALVQASLLTIGSVLVGIGAWPIVFIASFISSMLPVVGVQPVTVACAIYAASELDVKRAAIVVLFGLVASVVDNILRPLLISGGGSSINPILTFFALIGSLFVFGFAGLLIGPFVLIFASNILNKYKIIIQSKGQ